MRLHSLGALVRREWRSAWTRRSAYVERGVYVALLFGACELAWVAAATMDNVRPGNYAAYAHTYLDGFFRAQFILATILTTLIFSRSMMREKERGTLDLLLLAPLSRFEIVFGKMFGQTLGVAMLFLSGLPVIFFLLPLGGLGSLEVVSLHVILIGHLMAVAGICALLSSWFSGTIAVVVGSWLVVLAWLGAADFGRWAYPSVTPLWDALDVLNPFVYVDRELAGVESVLAESMLVLAGGCGVMMAGSLAAGALLARLHERQGSRPEGSVAGAGRRLRAAAVGRGLGWVFRPLVRLEHPLMTRECSLQRDSTFRAGWLVFAAVCALGTGLLVSVSHLRTNRLLEIHAAAAGWTALAGLAFSGVRSAVSLARDKGRGLYLAWLSANVEPGDIVRAKLYGQNLRAAYLLVLPALYIVAAVLLIEPEWEYLSRIIPALGGVGVGLLTLNLLGFAGSMFTRGGVLSVLILYSLAVPIAVAAAFIVGNSFFSLCVFGALWGAVLVSVYAFSVHRFRRWALGSA